MYGPATKQYKYVGNSLVLGKIPILPDFPSINFFNKSLWSVWTEFRYFYASNGSSNVAYSFDSTLPH